MSQQDAHEEMLPSAAVNVVPPVVALVVEVLPAQAQLAWKPAEGAQHSPWDLPLLKPLARCFRRHEEIRALPSGRRYRHVIHYEYDHLMEESASQTTTLS